MELKRIMKGNVEDCFALLQSSFMEDYQHNTEVDPVQTPFEGLSFKKNLTTKLGNSGEVNVTLTRFEANQALEIQFDSAQGINTIEYQLNQIDSDNYELTYCEKYLASSGSKSLNFKVMEFVTRRRLKKQAELTLNQIENILKQ